MHAIHSYPIPLPSQEVAPARRYLPHAHSILAKGHEGDFRLSQAIERMITIPPFQFEAKKIRTLLKHLHAERRSHQQCRLLSPSKTQPANFNLQRKDCDVEKGQASRPMLRTRGSESVIGNPCVCTCGNTGSWLSLPSPCDISHSGQNWEQGIL